MVRLEVGINNALLTCFKISIPVWYDWKNANINLRQVGYVISIPVWYDWKEIDLFA